MPTNFASLNLTTDEKKSLVQYCLTLNIYAFQSNESVGLLNDLRKKDVSTDAAWETISDYLHQSGNESRNLYIAIYNEISTIYLCAVSALMSQEKYQEAVNKLLLHVEHILPLSSEQRFAWKIYFKSLKLLGECYTSLNKYQDAHQVYRELYCLVSSDPNRASMWDLYMQANRKKYKDKTVACLVALAKQEDGLNYLKLLARNNTGSFAKNTITKTVYRGIRDGGPTIIITSALVIGLPITATIAGFGFARGLFKAATQHNLSNDEQEELVYDLHRMATGLDTEKSLFVAKITQEYAQSSSFIAGSESSRTLLSTLISKATIPTKVDAILGYMLARNTSGFLFNNGKKLFLQIANTLRANRAVHVPAPPPPMQPKEFEGHRI